VKLAVHITVCIGALFIAALFMGTALPLFAADTVLPAQLEGVGIEEHLGQPVNLDLTFTNEKGYQVPLRDFFHKDKPVLLNLVYYTCPMLCNMVLNAQTQALREVPWTPGNEFEIVTISINPSEMFDVASQKKMAYLESYGRPATGWHFLTDYQGHTKVLAEQMGFHYRYDERAQQFAHAAAIMFLTPDGKISRYLYGARFKPRDMRLALTEASAGKLGITVDRILLYCFHYDPLARSYTLFVTNLMRTGGGLMVLIFGFILIRLFRKERLASHPDQLVTAK
jgi:protein SCO1